MSEVYWSILSERAGAANDEAYMSHLLLATMAGKRGYQPMLLGYTATDMARNKLVKNFMQFSRRDDDLLVMLDGDHKYEPDIVHQFASEDPTLGVVGALAFRRSTPHEPLWFVRGDHQSLYLAAEYEPRDVYECAVVSTSAISIRRWVFVELERKGYAAPWFRYEYPSFQEDRPSEDMYFGYICERAGISHHVDTRIEIPHAKVDWVTHESFERYAAAHPEIISTEKRA